MILSSFPQPTATRTCLLTHFDVKILFHEFGHGVHDFVSKTKYARFHGPGGTAVDFGEAPSQMLENWCSIPSILKSLSKHYSYLSEEHARIWKEQASKHGKNHQKPPPEQIPDSLLEKVVGQIAPNHFLFHLSQLRQAIFDMAIHSPNNRDTMEQMDIATTYNRIRREVLPLDTPWALGEGDSWGHGYTDSDNIICLDYHAGYYGYFLY